MATKFRILERKHRNLEPRRAEISVEAMRLVEDIQTLEDMLHLLGRIQEESIARDDPRNYKAAKEEAYQALRRVAFILGEFQRIASDKLRYEYLSGERIKPRQKRQTLADIWELLKAELDARKKNEKAT
jgi:hypothetical protein